MSDDKRVAILKEAYLAFAKAIVPEDEREGMEESADKMAPAFSLFLTVVDVVTPIIVTAVLQAIADGKTKEGKTDA